MPIRQMIKIFSMARVAEPNNNGYLNTRALGFGQKLWILHIEFNSNNNNKSLWQRTAKYTLSTSPKDHL